MQKTYIPCYLCVIVYLFSNLENKHFGIFYMPYGQWSMVFEIMKITHEIKSETIKAITASLF